MKERRLLDKAPTAKSASNQDGKGLRVPTVVPGHRPSFQPKAARACTRLLRLVRPARACLQSGRSACIVTFRAPTCSAFPTAASVVTCSVNAATLACPGLCCMYVAAGRSRSAPWSAPSSLCAAEPCPHVSSPTPRHCPAVASVIIVVASWLPSALCLPAYTATVAVPSVWPQMTSEMSDSPGESTMALGVGGSLRIDDIKHPAACSCA